MVCRLVFVLGLCLLAACASDSDTSATDDSHGDAATGSDGGQSGPATPPDLTGLTGPCTAKADCVFACTVDYCGGCTCGSVGILASQQAELESRKAALATGCEPEILCSVWPEPPSAICTNDGSCAAYIVSSNEGLRACIEDTDCTVSTSGDVCSLCPCGGTAIATAELATWLERVEEMRFYCPLPTQEEIDFCRVAGMCATGVPVCNDGLCETHLQ